MIFYVVCVVFLALYRLINLPWQYTTITSLVQKAMYSMLNHECDFAVGKRNKMVSIWILTKDWKGTRMHVEHAISKICLKVAVTIKLVIWWISHCIVIGYEQTYFTNKVWKSNKIAWQLRSLLDIIQLSRMIFFHFIFIIVQ